MIIDAHTHVYPERIVERAIATLERNSGMKSLTNGMKSGLIKRMKEDGVDAAVLLPVATSKSQVEAINEEAGDTNADAKETGLFSFGSIHPETPDYKEVLRKVRDLGIPGIKLHPDYQKTFFSDIRYKRIVDEATAQGLYITVHAGIDIGLQEPVHCRPEHVKELLRDTGSDTLILAHMGGWQLWDEVEEQLAGENVYFDTAFSLDDNEVPGLLSKERFVRLVREHGADKVVFGTDSPWCSAANDVAWIKGTALTEEEKQMIFAENMKKILAL